MTHESTNKFLTEQIYRCWHAKERGLTSICDKCSSSIKHIDFITWEGFGTLWEWASKQAWWRGFAVKFWMRYIVGLYGTDNSIINPERFALAVEEFLRRAVKR